MERRSPLTAPYALVQSAFWMSVCVAIGFAAVYLQALGYTNTQLGVILAAGNTLGALLGPGLSARIDARCTSAARYIPPVLAVQAAALLLLALFPVKGILTAFSFTIYIAFCLSVNSLILKLYVDAEHGGAELNFSFTRGIGSLAYVLLSAALGPLVERFSVRALPLVGLALCAMQLFFCRSVARALPALAAGSSGALSSGSPMWEFPRRYPRFCVVLLGMICLFFAHNVFCNFMINVTRNVGGDTETMGYLNAFMAATEIPVMLLFHRVRKKRSSFFFLRTACILFSFKTLAITLAPNVPLLFAAMLLQGPSFGLYAACAVDYVGDVVPFEDSAKAQSLMFSMTTVGSVFASVIAGRLYDVVSVTATLAVGTVVCFAGTLIILFGLKGETA